MKNKALFKPVAFLLSFTTLSTSCNTASFYANKRIGHGNTPNAFRETELPEQKTETVHVETVVNPNTDTATTFKPGIAVNAKPDTKKFQKKQLTPGQGRILPYPKKLVNDAKKTLKKIDRSIQKKPQNVYNLFGKESRIFGWTGIGAILPGAW